MGEFGRHMLQGNRFNLQRNTRTRRAVRFGLATLLLVFVAMAGCGDPSALRPPDVDPAAAAAAAMEQYDTNGDGLLSAGELESCPGLAKMIKAYDSDTDGSISEAELASRIQQFVSSGAALVPMSVNVLLNKRPLSGATVRFVPESYYGGAIKAAVGTTASSGAARMAVPAEDLPENQQNLKAIQFGTYRVEITHPQVKLPAKYNTETTLGFETVLGQPNAEFRLQSSGSN